MTKTFAVIGDPIDHSLSPNIHNAAFRELGLDCTYIAYRIPKGELAAGIESLKTIKISGFNVTIPHKVDILSHIDEIDEVCKMVGAVNTVSNIDGKLKGYNTDMDGFLEPIKKRKLSVKGSSVLLLGAGGAARAIVVAFAKEKAKKITIANRTKQAATELVEFAQKIGIPSEAKALGDIVNTSDYKFIVNATSIGLKNEPCPIPMDSVNQDTVVYDIVYVPMNTDFINQAKKRDAAIIYGYEMLLGQASRAFEIWHGIQAPYNAMKKALLGGF